MTPLDRALAALVRIGRAADDPLPATLGEASAFARGEAGVLREALLDDHERAVLDQALDAAADGLFDQAMTPLDVDKLDALVSAARKVGSESIAAHWQAKAEFLRGEVAQDGVICDADPDAGKTYWMGKMIDTRHTRP
jgi:hypothetical protein